MTTDRQPYTREGHPGDVEIRFLWPTSNDPAWVPGVRVTIEDHISGQLLVDVDVPYAMFAQALGNRSVTVSGNRTTTHPERIGKYRQVTSTPVNLFGQVGKEKADQVASHYRANGWEAVGVDRTNYGYNVRAERWVIDPNHAALVDDVTKKLDLDAGLRDATGGK